MPLGDPTDVLSAQDAPPGHPAHSRVRYDPKTERAAFTYYGIHFQTTAAKAGSQQAAEVLARICWMQFEQKKCKEDVLSFRDKWYERLGTSKAKDRPATSSKASKVRNVSERPVKRTRHCFDNDNRGKSQIEQLKCRLGLSSSGADPLDELADDDLHQRTRSAYGACKIYRVRIFQDLLLNSQVTLKALCEKSHTEQRQWLSEGKSALTAQSHENVEGARVGSTAQLEKHESAVVQIVAKESSQNRTSTKANGKAADASKTTQDKVPENVEGAKDGSTVQLGKHESAVVQIVAKESKSYKAASSSQNGASTKATDTGKAADASKTTQDKVPESSEPAADKTLATKQMGKHEENVAQIQANGAAAKIDPREKPPSKPARKKADSKKALEIAGLESLQSLISRGCRLIAVAVPYSDFFNSSHLASLR
eukprot:symbB.v1.2.000100.t1/scaffold13.1/size649204/11